jgi:hypothetical protein
MQNIKNIWAAKLKKRFGRRGQWVKNPRLNKISL